jgi:CubicO group peptidase (beta-lactamase class C family)
MRQTGYTLPRWKPERIAVGYRNDIAWGRPNEKPWDKDGPYWNLRANGGILSTAADMYRSDPYGAGVGVRLPTFYH